MKLIKEYIFKDYPLKITVSKKRRNQYYTKSNITKTLEKHLDLFYEFDKKGRLIDIRTGEYILKNSKTAGKPRYKKIKGQDLHSLMLKPYERSAIIKELKEYFISRMVKQGKVESDGNQEYFVKFTFITSGEFLNNPTNKKKTDFYSGLEDIDSHQEFYRKVFLDCLPVKIYKGLEVVDNPVGFIPSDNYTIIKGFMIEHREPVEKGTHDLIIQIHERKTKY